MAQREVISLGSEAKDRPRCLRDDLMEIGQDSVGDAGTAELVA